MADQEDSEIDTEIRSLVSQLRETHEKLEEKILKLMKVFEEMARTDGDVEAMRASIEMVIKDREEVRKLLEEHAVFLNSRNNNSPETKTSRVDHLKECVEKFKNLDMGDQERQSAGHSGIVADQEREAGSYSGYVADGETEQKDLTFSLDDSDTTSEEEIERWNEKNVDPDLKRRFLEKVEGSSSSNNELEIEIEESTDVFDDKGFSTNIRGLWEHRALFVAGTSEEESSGDVKKDGGNDADMVYSADDEHISSSIQGLEKGSKKNDEDDEEDK